MHTSHLHSCIFLGQGGRGDLAFVTEKKTCRDLGTYKFPPMGSILAHHEKTSGVSGQNFHK